MSAPPYEPDPREPEFRDEIWGSVFEPKPEPAPPPAKPGVLRRFFAPIIGLLALLASKGKALLLLATKFKLGGTLLSMLASVGAYTLLWGWRFAALFVVLLFVHELGHALQLRR